MNYETKKSVIKASIILQTIMFISAILSAILAVVGYLLKDFLINYGIYYSETTMLVSVITAFVSTIYFCFFIVYLNKKQKQTKEEFYAKTKPFKAFAIVSLIFSTGIGIMLMFVAYTKDENKTKTMQVNKPKSTKKPKPILDKETKKEIRILKHQKRHGIISKENYQKKYNQLVKKQKQLD